MADGEPGRATQIDGSLDDWETSADAMRCRPGGAEEKAVAEDAEDFVSRFVDALAAMRASAEAAAAGLACFGRALDGYEYMIRMLPALSSG